jgi:hypothetical protein
MFCREGSELLREKCDDERSGEVIFSCPCSLVRSRIFRLNTVYLLQFISFSFHDVMQEG